MLAPLSDGPTAPSSPIAHSAQNATRTYLVTAHSENSVTLWNRSTTCWDPAATLLPQKSTITNIAFSSDVNPNTFVTCQADGTATVYTFTIAKKTTISTTATLRDADTLSAVAFSDIGQLATLGGGVLRIYGKRWGLLTEMDIEGDDVSFAPGGKAVIAGALGTIFRCIGEDFEWSLFASIDDSGGVRAVDWGVDGLIGVGREDAVEAWELQHGELVRIARFDAHSVETVQWDPVSGLLTSIHKDGTKQIWGRDAATWEWGLRDSVQPAVDAGA